MKLSILIATIPSRLRTFYPDLLDVLHTQIKATGTDDVEILGLYDNKKRSVGEKRNALINMANGKYLVFIDDDDLITPDYLISIIDAINRNPTADVVVYDCITTINGDTENQTYSKYSIENKSYSQTKEKVDGYLQWRGPPAHTMVWRSEIAKKHLYADRNYAEDVDWVVRAKEDIVNEARIDKVLYYYNFDKNVSETRR